MAGTADEFTTTELVWPDKTTEVTRTPLPFQTVETVNRPRRDQGALFDSDWPKNYPKEWRNRLIWGDNKYVMASLLGDFAGEIDLIYIDPPFATGADFTYEVEIGDSELTKQPSIIEELAYRDTWGKGLQSYLQMIYERLVLMKELLAEKGSIFVHLDWRVSHYVRVILDEIFGRDQLINEIIWCYSGGGIPKDSMPKKHDVIFWYGKSGNHKYNPVYREYSEGTKERGRTSVKGKYAEEGLREEGTPVNDWWPDVKKITSPTDYEKMYFPTQKSEELVGRCIKIASDSGDLVADFFCGSGTTGASAEKLGRRWIIGDLSRYAIQTTRKRLLNIHEYSKDYDQIARPFEILNMGKYEKRKFVENGHPPVKQYIEFILELYRAEPIDGYSLIHGRKSRRAVHVAAVDSIVTKQEVRDVTQEAKELGVSGLDVLGWDFEMGLDEAIAQVSDDHEIDIRLVQIPREATELQDAGEEIRFFDLNYVEVDQRQDGRTAVIELTDFVIANPEYLPEEAEDKIESTTDLIDYWAVDFNYKDDTFHNMWQSFRTRRDQSLDLSARHTYEESGTYSVLLKVVDVFGNDTNKLLTINTE